MRVLSLLALLLPLIAEAVGVTVGFGAKKAPPRVPAVLLGTPFQVDFTGTYLGSHLSGTGSSHSIVQANLFESSHTQNENYYGFTDSVSYAREIFIRYDIKFGANFDFGQGQKILRVRAFNEGGGVNYWDFIAQVTSAGSSAQQCGTTNSNTITISRNSGTQWGSSSTSITREQWYTYQFRFYLNSAQGVADGTFQMWIDGVSKFNITNLDLVGGGTWNNTINRVLYGGWYSNGAGGNPCAAPDPGPNTIQMRNAYHHTAYMP